MDFYFPTIGKLPAIHKRILHKNSNLLFDELGGCQSPSENVEVLADLSVSLVHIDSLELELCAPLVPRIDYREQPIKAILEPTAKGLGELVVQALNFLSHLFKVFVQCLGAGLYAIHDKLGFALQLLLAKQVPVVVGHIQLYRLTEFVVAFRSSAIGIPLNALTQPA